MQKLKIRCTQCGGVLDSLAQSCPNCPDALPRAEYRQSVFCPIERNDIFRYSDWLPPTSAVETSIGPVVYRSEHLASRLGLAELWVGFNGYAPEVGARNMTGTFKDFEALPTLLHLRESGIDSIILASAGNTARAFAYAATLLGFTAYIVVPERLAGAVWLPVRPADDVRLIAVRESGDYSTAIRLADRLASRFSIHPEGGARNVGRRDGMGTAILEHARVAGSLPRHYVQAIGSGTGGIAAWEAAVRLRGSGRFDGLLPRLHLVQNAPFTPIHDAWSAGAIRIAEGDPVAEACRIEQICASVLANRRPPYHVVGGVADALRATEGCTYSVTNAEIVAACELFKEEEGLPIGPESGAALSGLIQALASGEVRRSESILLHITGNGDALLRRDFDLRPVTPWLRLSASDAEGEGHDDLDRRFRP